MKTKRCILSVLLLVVIWNAGCDGGGGGPVDPAVNAPQLAGIAATPSLASPGSTIVFDIVFTDLPGDLVGGVAYVTDSRGMTYDPVLVSNAEGTSGTLTTIISLSPLVAAGELTFYVFVQDTSGNSSNTVLVTITIA